MSIDYLASSVVGPLYLFPENLGKRLVPDNQEAMLLTSWNQDATIVEVDLPAPGLLLPIPLLIGRVITWWQ